MLDSNMHEYVSSSTLVWRAIPEQQLEKLLTGLDCKMWEDFLNIVDGKGCDSTYSSAQVERVLQNIELALARQNMKDASSHMSVGIDYIPSAITGAETKALISSCKASCCLIDQARWSYVTSRRGRLPDRVCNGICCRNNESMLKSVLVRQYDELNKREISLQMFVHKSKEPAAEETVCRAEQLLFVIRRCVPANQRSTEIKTEIERIEQKISELRNLQKEKCWNIFAEVREKALQKKPCPLSAQSNIESARRECARCLRCFPERPEECKYFTRKSREQYIQHFGCSVYDRDIQEEIIGNEEICDAERLIASFQENKPCFRYKDDPEIKNDLRVLTDKLNRVREWQKQALLESVKETWDHTADRRLFQEKPLSLVAEQD